MIDLPVLLAALQRLPGFAAVALPDLLPLPEKGLAHDHVRIAGTTWLLRIPRQSQFSFSALDNLSYQQACFERAAFSGHTPQFRAVLPPGPCLPMGALLVEAIDGVPLDLPEDMAGIAACLAAIHSLPVPSDSNRRPLENHGDAVAGTLAFIERQSIALTQALPACDARRQIESELEWARGFAAESAGQSQPLTLVLSDTHPGNYLRRKDGRVICVDLEKALYGAPGIDLAHASLYTSTSWDIASAATLTRPEIESFYRHYLSLLPGGMADSLRVWLLPLRRLTWLRSVTWCVHYRMESIKARQRDKAVAASTEDWSTEDVDAALIAHVEHRVADYLDPQTIARIRCEWVGERPLSL
ncbi:MAG: aminoglycoside phosphotransferase family protein [Alphaproteobacteria bacterium]|nr:aminoglycoside phosphotransferase family protein [Alphaproteobacteria bacterium]MBU0798870.1 aminoglycoside phosphotransferase family protein [Alphaproteobacteria bacterium]MBU0888720.1 aminoglycoside phosphotransferase family protein [Alphaproteobacteria bacterium]MBU1813546.1 aminoglycoside phosphotransferase family protein [Alphaproteobacteria bacterium]